MMSPGPGAYRISKDMKQSKSGFSLGLGRQVEYILIKDIIYNINIILIYYWNIIEILIKDIILILIKDIILILIKDIILISKY